MDGKWSQGVSYVVLLQIGIEVSARILARYKRLLFRYQELFLGAFEFAFFSLHFRSEMSIQQFSRSRAELVKRLRPGQPLVSCNNHIFA